MKRLDDQTIRTQLEGLSDWSYHANEISRRVDFTDYAAVIGFVNRVAGLAEQYNHHPEMLVKYSEVIITFTTHDAGGVTQADIDSARRVDSLA